MLWLVPALLDRRIGRQRQAEDCLVRLGWAWLGWAMLVCKIAREGKSTSFGCLLLPACLLLLLVVAEDEGLFIPVGVV